MMERQRINDQTGHSSIQVTILLCTDRDDPLLARAIHSCLEQTYKSFEMIVVANGENSLTIYNALSKRYEAEPRIMVLQTLIRDLNFSLDLGLHCARGEYLARMDADDIMASDRIKIQHSFLLAHPETAVVGSSYELIGVDGSVRRRVQLPVSDKQIRGKLYFRNPICHPTVMFRTDIVRRAGGYRGGKNSEDYDLWTRLCLMPEIKFHNLPQYLLKYNDDPTGASRRSRSAYANVAAAQIRCFLLTWDIRWLLGAIATAARQLMRADKR